MKWMDSEQKAHTPHILSISFERMTERKQKKIANKIQKKKNVRKIDKHNM